MTTLHLVPDELRRPRLEGGGGGGCPILAFGISRPKYVEDALPIVEQPGAEDDNDNGE